MKFHSIYLGSNILVLIGQLVSLFCHNKLIVLQPTLIQMNHRHANLNGRPYLYKICSNTGTW